MRPKRRKSKDNPYTLSVEENNICTVTFKGNYNKIHTVKINEEIKNAINELSTVQKRRIILYYFLNYTQKEIADIEGTSIRAVQYTLNSALNKLRELLKHLEK